MNVTVYSQPGCTQCKATYRGLDKKGVTYNVIDVSEDPEALALTKSLGHMRAPVVVAFKGEEIADHWSGYNPEKIEEVALEQAALVA